MCMKLYTYPRAPSPRRVHLFLAEKGLEIDTETVDLVAGEQMLPAFLDKNPRGTVPALALDDGTFLCECVAICRYIEEIHPEPSLFGRSAVAKALIAERDHWVEMSGILAVVEAFRNSPAWFEDRALPGPRPVARIAELADRGRQRYDWFVHDLDGILADSEYVAGAEFSVADITALVTIDFAAWAIEAEIPEERSGVRRWHQMMNSRASVENEKTSAG